MLLPTHTQQSHGMGRQLPQGLGQVGQAKGRELGCSVGHDLSGLFIRVDRRVMEALVIGGGQAEARDWIVDPNMAKGDRTGWSRVG